MKFEVHFETEGLALWLESLCFVKLDARREQVMQKKSQI
jgi:hypothetical protein